MKFRVLGDLHLTNIEIIDVPVINKLKELIRFDETLIFLGDVFDSFDIGVANESFYEFISSINNMTYIIQGNHDFNRGLNSMSHIPFFSDRVKIVREYEFVDVNPFYRFHFLPYFRHRFDVALQPGENLNFLFSHCDVNKFDEIPAEFKKMTKIYNGHIHDASDYSLGDHRDFHNVGSFRQCKVNEDEKKRHFLINIGDDGAYSILKIGHDSPTVSQRYTLADIDLADMHGTDLFDTRRNGVVNFQITSSQDREYLKKRVEEHNALGGTQMILRTEMLARTKNDIESKIEQIEVDAEFDLGSIFDEFYQEFQRIYKIKEPAELLRSAFDVHARGLGSEALNIHSIKFHSIAGSNFKLFPDFEYRLDVATGITSIIGMNYDELQDDGLPSSNESGKSNIIMAFLYALLGTSSEVSPLRWGEKEGTLRLVLDIDGDKIEIERQFSARTSSLQIRINDAPFAENETATTTQEMFFSRYHIEAVVQFIFITNSGFSKYFFSSKSSERYNLFATIFPIITKVDGILGSAKTRVADLDAKITASDTIVKTYVENRRKAALSYAVDRITKKKRIGEAAEDCERNKAAIDLRRTELGKLPMVADGDIVDAKVASTKLRGLAEEYYAAYCSGATPDEIIAYQSIENKIATTQKTDLTDIRNKIALAESQIRDLSGRDDNYYESRVSGERQKLEVRLEQIRVNIAEFEAKIGVVQKIDPNVVKFYDSAVSAVRFDERALAAEKMRLAKINEEISGYVANDGIVTVCPTCGQEIGDDNTKILEAFDAAKGEKIKILKKISDLGAAIESNTKLCDMYFNEKTEYEGLANLKRSLATSESLATTIGDQIAALEEKKNSLRSADVEKLEELRHLIGVYNESVRKSESEERIFADSVREFERLKNGPLAPLMVRPGYIRGYLQHFETIERYAGDIETSGGTLKSFLEKLDEFMAVVQERESLGAEIARLVTESKFLAQREAEAREEYQKFGREVAATNRESKAAIRRAEESVAPVREDHRTQEILYKVLAGKKNLTFAKFFVGKFFSRLAAVFNSMLGFLFSRDVRIELDGVDFVFYDGQNEKIRYSEFSTGARTKIDLGLLLTINMIFRNFGVDSDLLFLDEFDLGLDQVNIDRVFSLLKHFYSDRKLLVISHKKIEGFSDRNIVVVRESGASRLEEVR